MDEKRFQSLMIMAREMAQEKPQSADYWAGYERGLRRAYHGEQFGTEEDHNLWLSITDDVDEARR